MAIFTGGRIRLSGSNGVLAVVVPVRCFELMLADRIAPLIFGRGGIFKGRQLRNLRRGPHTGARCNIRHGQHKTR